MGYNNVYNLKYIKFAIIMAQASTRVSIIVVINKQDSHTVFLLVFLEKRHRLASERADWQNGENKKWTQPAPREYRFNGARTEIGTGGDLGSDPSERASYR